jgi:imidazolonepropionase-like amidohydrolase
MLRRRTQQPLAFINLRQRQRDVGGQPRRSVDVIDRDSQTRSPSAQDEHTLLHPAGREALAKFLSGGRVVFGVARAAEIRRAIAFAKRYGMKPVIAGGAEAWVVADELAREKVPVLLDALENLPYTFDGIGARLDNAALLNRAGVRIAFTQFNESHNARKVRQLAGNAVAHGLPKDAALAALTVQPAEILASPLTEVVSRVGRLRTWCCGMEIRWK